MAPAIIADEVLGDELIILRVLFEDPCPGLGRKVIIVTKVQTRVARCMSFKLVLDALIMDIPEDMIDTRQGLTQIRVKAFVIDGIRRLLHPFADAETGKKVTDEISLNQTSPQKRDNRNICLAIKVAEGTGDDAVIRIFDLQCLLDKCLQRQPLLVAPLLPGRHDELVLSTDVVDDLMAIEGITQQAVDIKTRGPPELIDEILGTDQDRTVAVTMFLLEASQLLLQRAEILLLHHMTEKDSWCLTMRIKVIVTIGAQLGIGNDVSMRFQQFTILDDRLLNRGRTALGVARVQ
nr:hypothetical protein BOH68_05005 [Cobetia sp. MM1IDA2H-1]